MISIQPLIFAAILTTLFIVILIHIFRAIQLTLPNLTNKNPTDNQKIPLIGGLAIVSSFVIVSIYEFYPLNQYYFVLIMTCVAATLMGAIDDYLPFDPRLRLLIQAFISLSCVFFVADFRLNDLGFDVFGLEWSLGPMAIPISALGLAALANAYNMCDGIDGLAGSSLLVTLCFVVCLVWNSPEYTAVLNYTLIIIVCISVFLVFNLQLFKLPNVYLGDAGSMMLGIFVALVLIQISQGDNAVIKPVTALWLAGVPMVDMVCSMFRRYFSNQPLWQGDEAHIHHVLMQMVKSKYVALVYLTLLSISLALIGLGLQYYLPEWDIVSLLLLFGYTYLHYRFSVKQIIKQD